MKVLEARNYCYGEKKTSCTCFGTSNVARLAYYCVCKLQNFLKKRFREARFADGALAHAPFCGVPDGNSMDRIKSLSVSENFL